MQNHPSLNQVMQRWDKSREQLDTQLCKKRKPQVQDSFILTLDSEWHHAVIGKVNPPAVTNRQVLRGIT